ncbi:nuclear transport factor 2 family protein [Colwellia sp. 12G3]|uniref:nuclear transport factor 2 family protein n=1 Tax=Colwellia sp. 12G3 TaxID=2058299 RepID=UPI000C327431|nr:nuclear transport factor 2 family protein [Colwellia sp. 12G3]PKI14027.1 protein with SnoaL 3 domain, NTF 2 superfamily [Colwellia sp. 12G3]
MKKYYLLVATVVFGLTAQLCSLTALAASEEQSIAKVLNSFHQAAADAQAKPYFDLFSEEAIFLGTDASERWSKEEFKAFVVPYFSKGTGWLYTPTERNISLVKEGQVAFFDELLFSESYGTCRGSGVLIKTKQGWKISQYNLSIPMPNGLAKALVKQIKSFEQLQ